MPFLSYFTLKINIKTNKYIYNFAKIVHFIEILPRKKGLIVNKTCGLQGRITQSRKMQLIESNRFSKYESKYLYNYILHQ